MGGAGPQEESLVLFKKIILKKWYEGTIPQFVSSVSMDERSRVYVYDYCGATKTTPCSNPLRSAIMRKKFRRVQKNSNRIMGYRVCQQILCMTT